MAEYQTIEVVRDKKTVIATLKSGLKRDTVRELLTLFQELSNDDSFGAVVIAGDFGVVPDSEEMDTLCLTVENLPRPVIAAITGSAQGAGFELALACDLRTASETARFGFPGSGGGPAVRLAKVVGLAPAKHMAVTGQVIDPLDAEHLGLLSHTGGDGIPTARKLAKAVASRASRK